MSKPFDLERLLDTVFEPKPGERVAVFIDLENPRDIAGLKFLDQPDYGPQTIGYRILFQGLEALQPKMKFKSVEFYSYRATGGSNLDLPAEVFDREGRQLDLVKDVLPNLDLVIYTGTYSATAPITALARRMNFRGATMHGLNPTILKSGLSVDYRTVSRKAEAFRSRLSRSDWAEIEFEHEGQPFKLRIELSGQEAQKSHGLCPERGEIANLPAGEVYFVPTGAEGSFPIVFHDGTVALLEVAQMRVKSGRLLRGNPKTLEAKLRVIAEDPAAGELGELGLGTQDLPVSGADIQDEKILGTLHIATGRSDHLGGHLTPDRFRDKRNASHDDILFAPHKTPDIKLRRAVFSKGGRTEVVLQDYHPTPEIRELIDRA